MRSMGSFLGGSFLLASAACCAGEKLNLTYSLAANPLISVSSADFKAERKAHINVLKVQNWNVETESYNDQPDLPVGKLAVSADSRKGGISSFTQTDAAWFIPSFVKDFNLRLGLNLRVFQGILENVTIEQREFTGAVPVFYSEYEHGFNENWSWSTSFRRGEVLNQHVNDWKVQLRYAPLEDQALELGYQHSDSALRDWDNNSEVRLKNVGGYVNWKLSF